MDLDGTFFIELLIFGVFYFFVKSMIWPRFSGVLEERRIFIANGLQAAKEGQELLQDAHKEAEKILSQAHENAREVVAQTHKEMTFFRDQIRQEMEDFKMNIQKEVLVECDQLRADFMTHARTHYIDVATTLCEKVLFGHPDFCQKAIEDLLAEEGRGTLNISSLN